MNYEYDHMVGVKIRDLRVSQNLTQEQLAAKLQLLECDISRSTLANIEAGLRHIYTWELKAFREVLGVSCDDLIV